MKTILIATDFSEAANNASAYGVELAKIFDARVILFSAYQSMPVPVSEVPVILTVKELSVQVHRQLADTAAILSLQHDKTIFTAAKSDTPIHGILDAVKEHHVDLLIVGMKSNGKEFRRFFGNTVTGLIRQTQVPMLIIPEESKFSHISTMALATETDLTSDADPQVLDALNILAKRFDSKVYLVQVASNERKEAFETSNYPFEVQRRLRTLDTQYKCIADGNFFQAIDNFIHKYRVNILAMLPHRHSLLERWFIGSTTRTMSFNSSIPLLILPQKN